MPSVKIPRKSTATDMTPFVDVAFLILSFFMLATKFKPPEPAEIKTPRSVNAQQLQNENAVLVEFDSLGRVFISVSVKKTEDEQVKGRIIDNIDKAKNLGLTATEKSNFAKMTTVGVPFSELKNLLSQPNEKRVGILKKAKGIPVDSTNNELAVWINTAKSTFYDYNKGFSSSVVYMIKGDNDANYPTFEGVIEAMRRADQYSYRLITNPKDAPEGTELYKRRGATKK